MTNEEYAHTVKSLAVAFAAIAILVGASFGWIAVTGAMPDAAAVTTAATSIETIAN